MNEYDYFLGGRWRSRDTLQQVLDVVRAAGKSAYCFIENVYDDDHIPIDTSVNANVDAFLENIETIEDWRTNPTFGKIYENNMAGIRNAKEVIILLPAGPSSHIELGAAYGMGKKCYGIGIPERNETLYLMFDDMYRNVESFAVAQLGVTA